MNQETIPDNNLPVYFQKYKVEILDSKDNKTKTGSITYTTVGAIPSNLKNERVWAFNLTGTLKPNVDKYYIVYDFSKVESSFRVKFKDFVSGTITICGQVLDATKLIKDRYTYSLEDSIVTIIIDTSIWDFKLKKESIFSYNLMINDDVSSTFSCSYDESIGYKCQQLPGVVSSCNIVYYQKLNTTLTLSNGDITVNYVSFIFETISVEIFTISQMDVSNYWYE